MTDMEDLGTDHGWIVSICLAHLGVALFTLIIVLGNGCDLADMQGRFETIDATATAETLNSWATAAAEQEK